MTNELKVGLTVLVSILVLFFGVRFLEGSPLLRGTYELVAAFDDAGGLVPGSAVRLSGVNIGSVREVTLSTDARDVFALLKLRDDALIPHGSRVTIGGLAALGEVSVEISPPAVGQADHYVRGDTLVTAPVRNLLASLSDESGPIAKTDSLLDSTNRVMTGVNELIIDTRGDIAASASQLRLITEATGQLVMAESGRLSSMMASLQRASLSAERAAAQAELMSTDFGERAPGVADSLQQTISRLNTMMAQIQHSLVGFDGFSGELERTLAQINSTDGSLGLLLNDPSLYNNANGTTLALKELLIDFRNDPARYLREMRLVEVF